MGTVDAELAVDAPGRVPGLHVQRGGLKNNFATEIIEKLYKSSINHYVYQLIFRIFISPQGEKFKVGLG